MPQFKLIVLSNATEGREDEYNDWYTKQHLPDVLRVPGIVAAQRLKASTTQRSTQPQPWQYLAIYECDAPSVQYVVDGLGARSGTADMPLSTALAEMRLACYYEPITELMKAAK